ncbi:MAG: peptidylprolyl isomerase A [Planctomycetes bacterium HGW-Planctomycetes-1]|nr:MAG: peptidylprolyl isomerase A [Planctomycetes bacterium HGW-Planctomycetes-1]
MTGNKLKKFLIGAVLAVIVLQSGCDKQTDQTSQPVQKEQKAMTPQNNTAVKIKIETSKGDIVVELDHAKAPVTCKNFLDYVADKYYDGTIFHRVIKGFMIQGGGMTADMRQKQTKPSIVNEAKNGLKNVRGTIAMARTNDPDSATSQFFINHANNDFLNAGVRDAGYTVFGKVVEGMDVVDAIAIVPTRPGDVPVETVVIKSIRVE